MTHQDFDKLVRQVEETIGRNPAALRKKVSRLAVLGFGGLLASLGIVLVFSLLFIIPGIIWFKDAFFLLFFGGLILLLGGAAAIRALRVPLPPPEGREVTRAEAPALFALLDDLRGKLRSSAFHRVLIVGDCNAAVVQRPRLGFFGWYKNDLLIGLPLMEVLGKEELLAVLAHEFAHLSKQHGQSSQWIYRLRRSWERIFQNLARPQFEGQVSLRPLIVKFVDWFWPRFNAHAFVMSRAYEFDADATAARLTGADSMAACLLRTRYHSRLIDEKFWPDLWQLAAREAAPPENVYLRLSESLHSASGADQKKWLEQAFAATTTNADTHPCLTERLRAIGIDPVQLAANAAALVQTVPQPNSAQALLGNSLEKIRADVEQRWRKECAENWTKQHSKAGALHDRLDKIEKIPVAKTQDADALWDKARVFLELRKREDAIPILREILAVNPKHEAANFEMGRHLLNSGDAAGEAFLERAIAEDEELLPPASELLHLHFRSTGQAARIQELYARLDRYEKSVVESRKERSNITARDNFIAHELSPTELAPIKQALEAEADVVDAWLARKELKYFVHQRLFLLCVRIRPSWHRLPNADREQAAVACLIKSVRLPGRVFIFAPSGDFRSIARKVKNITAAQIFHRGTV